MTELLDRIPDQSDREWSGTDSLVCAEVAGQAHANLEAYRVNPPLLEEQANIELAAAEGGYGRRQLYELVQNGADALLEDDGSRIEVVLTDGAFYCANEGAPIDVLGVRAILLSNVSQKRGDQIGRFGLGFKSVLEVTDSPEFYSRSGSFAWDYGRAKAAVGEAVPGYDPERLPVPKLRLAWPVDPHEAFAHDTILAELSEWATTIVKLPLTGGPSALAEDIAEFPAPFLLFCRHVRRVVLDDRSSLEPQDASGRQVARRREISLEALEQPRGCLRLSEDDGASVWKVFSKIHNPTPAALEDAGTMAKREQIEIHWAMPLSGRKKEGLLWAFFPTEYETTLSGIVNAPWKTNPDRKNLLEGDFNREVLDVVAELVIGSLQKLHDRKDPGRLLDVIPARGDEARNWADRHLTERYYQLAADAPSLPDQDGQLRRPGELSLHPRLKGTGEEARASIQELLQMWADAAPSRDWCHPTVERRERRPRVERLVKDGGGTLANWRTWLEALVNEPSVPGSKTAVQLAARLKSEGFAPDTAVEAANIVLTADDRLVSLSASHLYFEGDYAGPDDADYVHQDLANDPDARRALEQLGVVAVDATADLEALLRQNATAWGDEEWNEFWVTVRRVGSERATGILKARRKWPFVRVRTGRFRPLRTTLLPGSIVPADSDRDRDVAVDTTFHAEEIELLQELGLGAAPERGGGKNDEPWFDKYRMDALVRFRRLLTGRRPHEHLLGFFENRPFAGPLSALESLSDEGRALLTDAALSAENDFSAWVFCHTSNPDGYPKLEMPSPVTWRLRDAGRFETSRGFRPIDQCVAPVLSDWADVLPVAKNAFIAGLFDLPTDLSQVSGPLWEEALEAVGASVDDARIGLIYVAASAHAEAPQQIYCRVGDGHELRSPKSVTVVWTRAQLQALIPQQVPTVLAPTAADAETLRTQWGMSDGEEVDLRLAYGAAAEETPLVDRFPSLQWQLDDERRELVLVPCEELRLETVTSAGRTAEEVDLHIADGKVFYDAALGDHALLLKLAPALHLSEHDVEDAVTKGRDAERRRKVADVRSKTDLPERLLAAVGEARLRAQLPKGLLVALEAEHRLLDGKEIAELALAVYGVDALRAYRSELDAAGFEAPRRWNGSGPALSFTRRLGFPREFAGFEHPRRSPLLEVQGPPQVPDLHPFQRQIVDEFGRLLRGDPGGNRAILSLPTGAGKTRVAVEALIEAVHNGAVHGPILWVAQTDELCEQAVQTWSFVWRGIGLPRETLAISRLWKGNEAQPVDASAQVVVATISKLQPGCVRDPEYAWLSEAGCVVVDEAHHSTAPSYSQLLRWLKLDAGKQTRPLVGLTATPYRGISEKETKRLVDRYGARRLDAVAFGDENPYPILQRQGILANVEHRLIEGADVELDAAELAHVRKMRVLPPRAESALGRSVGRNQRILAEVKRLPEDWTILLFATSVDHAETMAALLTLEGIEAKPISGSTEDGPRRHYVEEFREQRIRVLTNYNVLTQGFDAPAVRAVIVARPTYSPNLYQQMIGRGLRGVENGGKDTCLIVNVQDNVVSFGEDLAFREFEYLWDGSGRGT